MFLPFRLTVTFTPAAFNLMVPEVEGSMCLGVEDLLIPVQSDLRGDHIFRTGERRSSNLNGAVSHEGLLGDKTPFHREAPPPDYKSKSPL